MSIAQILLSLIMVGLAASLVFVHLELKEVRSDISLLRSQFYNNEHAVHRIAKKLDQLVAPPQPQSDARKQMEQELSEIMDRYIK